MSLVRWFNRAIEGVPVTLTLLIGGVLVWPAAFALAAWALIWVLMAPGLAFPGLR